MWRPALIASTSLGRASVCAVLMLAVRPLGVERGALAVFAIFLLFSIVDPIAVAFRRTWLSAAAVSVIVWLGLFLLVAAAGRTEDLREGATIYILPMMLYPAILVLTGVGRAIRRMFR